MGFLLLPKTAERSRILDTEWLGYANCVRVFVLFRAAPFSAPAERGARTAQAVRPNGRRVFAEPQRGIRRRCGGNVEAPAAGAKRKDNLRFSFLFELLPFPCFLIRRRFPICDRFENRERQSGYLSVCFATYSQFTDRLLLHIRATLRRHGICEYNLLHNISCRVRRPRRTVCKFIGNIYLLQRC